jgi:acyl-CoA reductase-like NAD-dependent aldehyde dehydrogenase
MATPDLTPMRIGSKEVNGDRVAPVLSPYDGSEVGSVPVASAEHIDAAVEEALARHREGALPAWERALVLDRAAVLLQERQEQFARIIASEAAKPVKTARVEAARAVDTFRFSAAVARTLTGETVPLDASSVGVGKLGFVLRVPVGVVGAISPFNFPLNLVAHKVAPAIATGCPVVLKPASATPLTALALGSLLLDECGLPPGWLHVVTCPGSVANHLVEHPDVAMVTFTGSPDVGWGIRSRAARKKVSLELGNNSPVVIEPDADWQTAAAKISLAGYSYAGQSCISVQRVYVHSAIARDFTAALVGAVEELEVGDPLDETTDVSALIDRGETERVRAWIDEAVLEGATLETGGTLTRDDVLRPTVLSGVRGDMRICHTEVFGPVVGVQAYDDFDHALHLANESRYGLQAGVFTNDLGKALRAARTLDFGGVTVNEVPTWRADQMPYGGIRDSGNTREGPAWTAREMTEERLVVIQET